MKLNFSENSKGRKEVSLDLKDKKILSLLGTDSRIPVSQIAKKVALSHDSVRNRINRYLKSGLIQGFRTIVDIGILGYENYHMFLNTKHLSNDDEEKFVKKICDLPFVRAVLKFSGKYDFEIAMIAKNPQDFEDKLEYLVGQISEVITDYDILTITGNYKYGPFPKSFIRIENDTNTKEKIISYSPDTIDFKILKIITDNAKEKLFKIANDLNISSDTVNYRIKKMTESGIIIKSIPAIDYDRLGYNIYAIPLKINLTNNSERAKLKEFFNTDNNILWAAKTLGKYNIIFYISTKRPEEIHNTLSALKNIFPERIKKYEALIASEEYKFTYLPKEILNENCK